ncbi:hypothetical protein [Thalassotalea marina]|uniref:AsmA family protein n=1 Tax=Thalassotalea marina TaxID=1673741 RepID=A0A919EHF4_9GAMM|nr:hypothetical protein [Thalassotalea marina]GHF83618.1 hypothetical protein GCM10017161_08640 [Thalassotalea marina]
MKILASIVVVILLLCGGALWFLAGGSLNELIKAQIESQGKALTEQTVTVDTVDIQLTKGAGSILGIKLPNPSKYTYPNAFTLGEVTLDINLEATKTDHVVLDAIIINSPKAFVQLTENGNANIKELMDTIEKNMPKSEKSSETKPQGSSIDPLVTINKLVLADTALTVDLTALGNKEHSATLPNITLTKVGGDAGIPASQVGGVIAKEMLSEIWRQTKKVQKEKIKEKATEELKEKAKKKLSELFN